MSSTPTTLITKEFLENLLGRKVLHYTAENDTKPGDGYMSITFSFKVYLISNTEAGGNGNQPVKETRHLFFKCFPQHPARQGYLKRTNVFFNELAFYRDWVKALRDFQIDIVGLSQEKVLTPAFPPFVGGHAIDFSQMARNSPQLTQKIYSPLDNFIAMENLKEQGFRLVDKASGLDLNHLTLSVTEIAKEHALGWGFRNNVDWDVIGKFPFLNAAIGEDHKEVWDYSARSRIDLAGKTLDVVFGEGNHLSRSMKVFGGRLNQVLKFFMEQGEAEEKEAWGLHRSPPKEMVEASKNDVPWRLQTHGDIWSNNMLFKYNHLGKPTHVMLMDLQVTRQGCPTSDLSYMIITATDSKFRKAHLDSLLQLYCDKFTEYCQLLEVPLLPGFCFESLKRRFQRAKFIGFLLALILYPIMFMDSDSEVNLDEAPDDADLRDLLVEAFDRNAFKCEAYREKLVDLVEEFYEEGVI